MFLKVAVMIAGASLSAGCLTDEVEDLVGKKDVRCDLRGGSDSGPQPTCLDANLAVVQRTAVKEGCKEQGASSAEALCDRKGNVGSCAVQQYGVSMTQWYFAPTTEAQAKLLCENANGTFTAP